MSWVVRDQIKVHVRYPNPPPPAARVNFASAVCISLSLRLLPYSFVALGIAMNSFQQLVYYHKQGHVDFEIGPLFLCRKVSVLFLWPLVRKYIGYCQMCMILLWHMKE